VAYHEMLVSINVSRVAQQNLGIVIRTSSKETNFIRRQLCPFLNTKNQIRDPKQSYDGEENFRSKRYLDKGDSETGGRDGRHGQRHCRHYEDYGMEKRNRMAICSK